MGGSRGAGARHARRARRRGPPASATVHARRIGGGTGRGVPSGGARVRVVVLCPHFEPDTAPTGVVMTRIVNELARRGHELHVVTSLPWYRAHRIEPEWGGGWTATEATTWGSVTRVHP